MKELKITQNYFWHSKLLKSDDGNQNGKQVKIINQVIKDKKKHEYTYSSSFLASN